MDKRYMGHIPPQNIWPNQTVLDQGRRPHSSYPMKHIGSPCILSQVLAQKWKKRLPEQTSLHSWRSVRTDLVLGAFGGGPDCSLPLHLASPGAGAAHRGGARQGVSQRGCAASGGGMKSERINEPLLRTATKEQHKLGRIQTDMQE